MDLHCWNSAVLAVDLNMLVQSGALSKKPDMSADTPACRHPALSLGDLQIRDSLGQTGSQETHVIRQLVNYILELERH